MDPWYSSAKFDLSNVGVSDMAAARRIGPAGGASGHQPPPSSTVASSTGLHLPISTSGLVTSLHQFVGSKANADPTVLSSSHSQTKASASFLPINSAAATNSSALTSTHADNNNTAALHRQKRAGFSLPLPNNLLPNTTSTRSLVAEWQLCGLFFFLLNYAKHSYLIHVKLQLMTKLK